MPQTPKFWWRREGSWPQRLLAPIGAAYGAVTARRMARPGHRLDVPVICIGNFTAGGAGKTPTALWVIERLIGRGLRPAVLSRGYGRQKTYSGVIKVDASRHTAREVGDEPLLLARAAPSFVAADRRRSAEAALADGANVLVLDDGLQNPSLVKTASIAVVDGTTGIGNGACVPAGPLRAPLDRQWPYVSLAMILGEGVGGDAVAEVARRRGVAVARASLRSDAIHVTALRGRRLLAFAGIGRPEKFFATLDDQHLTVVGRRGFPDHHGFSDADLAALGREARTLGADLVTTEKDKVRLPAGFACLALPVSLHVADPSSLDAMLDRALGSPDMKASIDRCPQEAKRRGI